MKEIIKKSLIGVVAVILVIAVAVFALKGDDPEPVEPGSSAGTSQSSASSGEDSPSADKGTSPSVNGSTPSDSQQSPDNGTTGSQNVQNPQSPSQSADPASQQSSPSQGAIVTPDSPSVTPNTPAQTGPTNKIDKFQEIFKNGKFLMKVNDPDLGPVTMAMSGNKMFVEASMEGLALKMLYDGDKPDEDNPSMGTWYIVIDKIKKYSPMPSDMVGDMNVEELTGEIANSGDNTVYTKSVETINGEQLECESCVDSNGNTTKYYFRGDQLVRSDSIAPSGAVSTTEFQEISANVDDSLFQIPAGYAKWDISWLLNMMG